MPYGLRAAISAYSRNQLGTLPCAAFVARRIDIHADADEAFVEICPPPTLRREEIAGVRLDSKIERISQDLDLINEFQPKWR